MLLAGSVDAAPRVLGSIKLAEPRRARAAASDRYRRPPVRAENLVRRSVLVGGVEAFGETQTGCPVLAALQETPPILELAASGFAGLPAGDRAIFFSR